MNAAMHEYIFTWINPWETISQLEAQGCLFRIESTCDAGKYLVTFSKDGKEFSAIGPAGKAISDAAAGILEMVEGKK